MIVIAACTIATLLKDLVAGKAGGRNCIPSSIEFNDRHRNSRRVYLRFAVRRVTFSMPLAK